MLRSRKVSEQQEQEQHQQEREQQQSILHVNQQRQQQQEQQNDKIDTGGVSSMFEGSSISAEGKRKEQRTERFGLFLFVGFVTLFTVRMQTLFYYHDGIFNHNRITNPKSNLNIDIPIDDGGNGQSSVFFVCCQRLYGELGNQGQLSRSLYIDHPHGTIPVNVRYMNAPCFSEEELRAGNPKEDGKNWPVYKTFPIKELQVFRQRVAEIHQSGGIILPEGNCKIPQTELTNIWLESMIDERVTGPSGTVNDEILQRFALQDKRQLRNIIVRYGFEDYVPKHYDLDENMTISTSSSSSTSSSTSLSGTNSIDAGEKTTRTTTTVTVDDQNIFPLVLKREKSEGGVGVYIVHSYKELKQRMEEDNRYEGMGMRHSKARHRTLGTGWVLEEFLPGATQELIVYLRPRGGGERTLNEKTTTSSSSSTTTFISNERSDNDNIYFWCGSHSNQRWHDDGKFVKGFDNIRGTVTTPKNCTVVQQRHPRLFQLLKTIMIKEHIYGTGCINYKYSRRHHHDSTSTSSSNTFNDDDNNEKNDIEKNKKQPKIHDWNLRTCSTMVHWNKGQVFLDLINQIPRRNGGGGGTNNNNSNKQLALFV